MPNENDLEKKNAEIALQQSILNDKICNLEQRINKSENRTTKIFSSQITSNSTDKQSIKLKQHRRFTNYHR